MATVVLAQRARQRLFELDWPLIDAVEDALGLLERDPHIGYALRGRLHGVLSLRVGTYRIIYLLADDDQTVRVAAIRHRSIAYRNTESSVLRLAENPRSRAARAPQRSSLTRDGVMLATGG